MDFHCMKRKQLQALCKQHNIPANLSNLEMANKLTEFLKEKESSVVHAVLEEQEGILSEIEANNAVANRKVKKVRFSPDHELIEFTRWPQMKRRSRRNSVNRRDSNWSVEIVGEVNKQSVGRRGRTTRTGESKLMEAEANQKKSGTQALRCIDEKTIASAVDIIDGGESEEGDVVRSGRVTRLRGKMAAEGVKTASNRERKRVKDEDITDEKNVHNDKQQEDIVDNRGRVTRSRAHKLTEAPVVEEKRERAVVKSTVKVVAVRAESSKDSSSKRGGAGEGKSASDSDERIKGNGKGLEEILVNKQIAGEHVTVEPQVLLRRSKRKANGDGDSEILTNDTKKDGNGSRKTSKPLVSDGIQVDADIIESEVNPGRRAVLEIEEPIKNVEPRRSNRRKTKIESDNLRDENENRCPLRSSVPQSDIVPEVPEDEKMALQPIGVVRRSRRKTLEVNPGRRAVLEIEEPIKKVEPRRSNRNKTMIESDNIRDENENRCPLRSSVPQSDIVPEVPEDEKMALQPIGVVRRSRRKTLGVKLASATNDTDSAVENCKAEKLASEPAVQMNTRLRRNTPKCQPPGLLDKIGGDSNIHQKIKVMKRKRGHVSGGDVLKNKNDLNSGVKSKKGSSSNKVVSSHHGSSRIGESLSLDVQLSASKDSESENNLCSKNIISDVERTSIRKTERKEEEVSNADSADSSCVNLINGEELAKLDTNAASKIAQLETDSTLSEDQYSTSNTGEVEKSNSLLEIDGQESIEQNATNTNKNDPEAQVYSQMEDSSCNNKINDQVLAEALDVSGEEGSAEARSSADRLVLDDQTDAKTVQSCPRVVDHHNDLDHLEAPGYILDTNNDDTSQTAREVGAFEPYEADYTHSKSTLQLKLPSSGRARHHDGDNVAEGNETFFHKCIASELAEADEDGCSKDHRNASNHSSEFDMPGLSNGERDARIVSQERGTFPSEYSVMNSDEQHEVFHAVATTAICTNSVDVNLKRGHEDEDQMTKREERYIDEGINSEVSETHEGESSMGHKSKCDGDGEISLANLFDGEGRYAITPQDKENFSGEHSIKHFNVKGMLHGSPSVEPTSTCNSTGEHEAEHEAKLSAEGRETNDKRGCLKSHESSKDEDWEFSCFNLFDEEEGNRIKPQDGVVSAKYFIKDLNEVKCGRESSNLQETHPYTPSSEICETQEQQKSLLAKSNAENTSQRQEAWSNASVLVGNATYFLKSYSEGEISQVAEGAAEDVNHANYGFDKEDSAGACISDVKSCPTSSIAAESFNDIKFQDSVETERQHVDLLAGQTESDAVEEAIHAMSRQSWTENELHNLFGTTSDEDAPGLGDTFCQGTEIAAASLTDTMFQELVETEQQHVNLLAGQTESDAEIGRHNQLGTTSDEDAPPGLGDTFCQGTQMEIEGESRNVCAETKNKNVVLPTGFSADNGIDENQLKFLFATPVKIITPCKIEESVTSIKECSGTMKGNVATESTSNEKAQNKVENNLCVGASLSDNGGDGICEEMNEVEGFELLNTSTRILSGAGYDGCEALEVQMAQIKEECLKETNLTTEEKEEHAILLTHSCLHNEATEKNIVSSSGTHMSETLSCQSKAHNKSEGEMAQSTEAVFELSPILLSKASLDCDSTRHRESDDQYEGDGKDVYGELHSNSKVSIRKSVSVSYNLSQELDQLPSSDELESTCKEAEEMWTTLGDILPDIGGDDTCDKINKVESVELKDSSTTPLSKTEYDGCEASEEQLTENTGECQKETNFITEDNGKKFIPVGKSCLSDEGIDNDSESIESVELKDTSATAHSKTEYDGSEASETSEEQLTENTGEFQKETNFITEGNEEKIIPLGQSCLSDEGTDNDSQSEENIISLSCSPNNLDKLESCEDMLIETFQSESLKSQQKMIQTSEAALELSVDNLQNSSVSKNSRLTACFADDNISKEVSLIISSVPLVEESAITGIFDGQNAKDEGTSLHHSFKASPVDDVLTQRKDTDDLNGAKFSPDMSDEVRMNSEVAASKSLSNGDNLCEKEADNPPCSLELKSMIFEAKEAGATGQDPNNIVALAEHGFSVCGAASSIEKSDAATPIFNLNGDNEKKNSETAEENSAAQMVQFSIQEPHFEENVEDLKNDTHIISQSPASECNEILKESDVADTIKEYIDSESSLSVIFENSTASLSSDVSCDNSALSKHEDCIAGRLANSNDKDNMPSVDCLETEIKEPEESTLFIAEGTSVELDSQKIEFEDGQMHSTRKNARTILIHGTPGKPLTMADMKENAETHKRSNMGDITAVRPAKRRALQDLQWK